MLGYTEKDVDEMVYALQSILTTVNPDDDPLLHGDLSKTKEFLEGLWAEGYFD